MSRHGVSKFFVKNIPWSVGTFELKNYFSQFGPVAFANVVFDKHTGLSKQYGFVYFNTPDALGTVTNNSTHVLEGNTLVILPS